MRKVSLLPVVGMALAIALVGLAGMIGRYMG